MWNKRRKEEYYRRWVQLEPVVEDEDEDGQHEGGDSGPSSLTHQTRGLIQHFNGVSRDAYETVLLEIEELQIQLMEEQQELRHARSQIRELERALLQEVSVFVFFILSFLPFCICTSATDRKKYLSKIPVT